MQPTTDLMSHRSIYLLFASLLLACLVAACGGKPAPTTAPAIAATQPAAAPQPTQPVAAQATQPAAAPSSPVAATKTSPTVKPATGKFANPDELNSYRMKTTTWEKGGDKAVASVILTEWVKASAAKRTVIGETETITIGDKTWAKLMGRWVQQDRPQATQAQSADLMKQIEDKIVYKEVGRETVNGVACKKYTYSGEATVKLTEGALKGETTVRGQGEAWVADQAGLPAVIVRNRGESETKLPAAAMPGAKSGDLTVAMSIEMELYDINAAITIAPPTDVFTPPAAPTGAAVRPTATRGATTAPKPPAATAAAPAATPAGATTTVGFETPLDRSWYRQGAADAEVGIEARPGYLRITAASGSDLLPGLNFDAPNLFRVVGGDFTIETAVEFDPQEDYQGAGLFIWQDEANFVRLERCYGGLGGGESGICFLKVEKGAAEVIADANDIPTAASRVELRLQKLKSRVSAWWRDPSMGANAPWQPVGSTAIDLPGGPQPLTKSALRAGLILCVGQNAAEASADFDYWRMTQ